MRELKFRGWDEKIVMYVHSDGTGLANFFAWADQYKYIIEQYTGLTDKNGKEIFEGDILKFPEYIMKDYKFINGVVEWENGCLGCRVQYNLRLYPTSGFEQTDLKNIEIVGNIHENPELLK